MAERRNPRIKTNQDLEINCDHKTVIFSLQSNEQGNFMKVFERMTDDRRTTPRVIVDEDSFEILLEIIMEYCSDYEDIASSRDGGFLVRTKSFNRGYRLYYLDVFQIRKVRHFRLTVVANGRRKYVSFPFSYLPTCYKRLSTLVRQQSGHADTVPLGESDCIHEGHSICAPAYTQSDKKFKEKRRNFWKRWREYFPPQNDATYWKVYHLMEKMFPFIYHYGLVFEPSCEYEGRFRVDLGINNDKVSLDFEEYDEDNVGEYLGTVELSGNAILLKAHDRMLKMGNYNNLTNNNCQTYVKQLAKDLGLPKEVDTLIDKIFKSINLK